MNNIESKLEAFNDKLPVGLKISIMKFCDVQKYLKSYSSTNNIQWFLLKVDHVERFEDHVEVFFKNKRKINAFFDGHYEKYDINGNKRSTGGVGTPRGIDNGRVKISIDGMNILLERLILIACDIHADKVAVSYKGLEANVLDGSGNVDTAERLMIKPNFSPDNLEWCLKSDNVRHSHMIKKLLKKTGIVYRFSALDNSLVFLVQRGNNNQIKHYCSTFLERVR